MREKTLWITQTAILIALLIILQSVTASLGQLITGTCVNTVLAFSGLAFGISNAAIVALLSPFFAFILGIGPAFLPIVPAIAAGNLVYVLIIAVASGKGMNDTRNAVVVSIGAVAKFMTLYYLVVRVICNALPLKEQQVTTFTKMFSFPQLITALAGGILAMLLAKALRKVINKEKNRTWKKQAEEKDMEGAADSMEIAENSDDLMNAAEATDTIEVVDAEIILENDVEKHDI